MRSVSKTQLAVTASMTDLPVCQGRFLSHFFEAMSEFLLAEVPKRSPFRRALKDVRKWHKRHPEDWRAVWLLVKARYGRYPDDECGDAMWNCAVSAIINGALGAMVPKSVTSAESLGFLNLGLESS